MRCRCGTWPSTLQRYSHAIFADAKVPPIVQVEQVRNKTSEHIDTEAITDTIRTMENFGFLAQGSDGTFRLLPPAHRLVDACVAAGLETETDTAEEAA